MNLKHTLWNWFHTWHSVFWSRIVAICIIISRRKLSTIIPLSEPSMKTFLSDHYYTYRPVQVSQNGFSEYISKLTNKQINKRNNEFAREYDGRRIEEELKVEELERLNWSMVFIKTLYVCINFKQNILLKIT